MGQGGGGGTERRFVAKGDGTVIIVEEPAGKQSRNMGVPAPRPLGKELGNGKMGSIRPGDIGSQQMPIDIDEDSSSAGEHPSNQNGRIMKRPLAKEENTFSKSDPRDGAQKEGGGRERCLICRRAACLKGSKLLRCNLCPRSCHMACLGSSGDNDVAAKSAQANFRWQCAKCHLKESARLKRLQEQEDRMRRKQMQQLAKQEEKEERERYRLEQREERERKKQEDREEKYRHRVEEREKRRNEKMMAKRRNWQYPVEDLELEDDEEANEAASGIEGAPCLTLVKQQRPEPQPVERLLVPSAFGPGKLTPWLFGTMLEVWDFCQGVGKKLKCPQHDLVQFMTGVSISSRSPILGDLYVSLLRALLDIGAGQTPGGREGAGVSEETLARWARLLDSTTWPELVRRYFVRGYNQLCKTVKQAVQKLGCVNYWELDCESHLALLKCLCDDILDADSMKQFLESQMEAAIVLCKGKRAEEMEERRIKNEEKRREKDLRAAEREEQLAAWRARLATMAAGNGSQEGPGSIENVVDTKQEPTFEVPEHIREFKGDHRDRRAVLAHKEMVRREEERLQRLKVDHMRKKEKEQRAAKKAREEEQRKAEEAVKLREEREKKREETFEREMCKLILRAQPLGKDRYHNRYWWFPGESCVLFVEESLKGLGVPDENGGGYIDADGQLHEQQWWGYSTKEEVDALVNSLNPKGIRESALQASITHVYDKICQATKNKKVGIDGSQSLEEVPGGTLENEQKGDGCAQEAMKMQTAIEGVLMTLQEQLEGLGQRPQGGWSGWRRRLRSSPTFEDFKYLLLRLEEIVFEMGGSPAHASNGHVEEEEENHVNAGASEADGLAPEVNQPTVSELEDEEELTDGEESSRDSRLWHMPAIRKAWQREVESAATLSSLAYASQSLCERALQVFEVKNSGKRAARGKRSASAYLNQVESRYNRNESSGEDSGAEEEEEEEVEEEEEEDQEEEEDDDENEEEDEEDVSEEVDKADSEEESSDKDEEEDETTSSSESSSDSESGSGDGEESSHKSEQQDRRGVKRKSRTDGTTGRGRRGRKPKSEKPAASVDRWPEVCSKCHKKGKLICCDGDGCTYAIHKGCAHLRRVPRGRWFCFACQGNSGPRRRGRPKGSGSGKVQGRSRKKPHSQRNDSASGRRAGRGNRSGKSQQTVDDDSSSDSDDSSSEKELGSKGNGNMMQGCEGSMLAGRKVNASAGTREVAEDLTSRRRGKRKMQRSEATDERASGSKRGRGSDGQRNELPSERSGSIKSRSNGAEEKQDMNSMEARTGEAGGVCTQCQKEGELLRCSTENCSTALHLECARLRAMPKGMWICFSCRENGAKARKAH